MKNLVISLTVLLSSIFFLKAQVTENFDHGNRNISRSNCWQTWSTDVKTKNYGINSGAAAPMLQTGQLSGNNHELISPFVDFSGTGSITFKHKLSNTNGNDRSLTVTLLDENGTVLQTLLTHIYKSGGNTPNGNPTNTLNESITVTWAGVRQIKWLWTGSGGTSRGLIDDVSIAGTFAADPAQNRSGVCPALPQSNDSDGDGVDDNTDMFPNDSAKVYVFYNPSENQFNSLAYEDLWPTKGDYDFNDLVIDQNLAFFLNANQKITQITATYVVRAKGGGLIKGFGVHMPNLAPNDIGSITGNSLTTGTINTNANGTESGQSNAVILFTDDIEQIINRASGSFFNTIKSNPTGTSDTLKIVVSFSNPPDLNDMNNASVFAYKNRDEEIHQVDREPTDLHNAALFGTGADNSNPATGRYYRTENNLPWALEISQGFDYPEERVDMVDAYLNFATWALSGGTTNQDWYTDAPGNRDVSKIY